MIKYFMSRLGAKKKNKKKKQGLLKEGLNGEALPQGQPLTLLYTIFHKKKGSPFVYFLLTIGTPFIYLV